jgi:hypothetical protein
MSDITPNPEGRLKGKRRRNSEVAKGYGQIVHTLSGASKSP